MSSRNTKLTPEAYFSDTDLARQRKSYSELCRATLTESHMSNFMWNFPLINHVHYPGILGFKGAFPRTPAVIVSCGPSLDVTGPLLKGIRDKCILIACDAALPVMVKKYGVYPHFVVMIDPTAKQKDNFKDIDTTKFYTIVPPIVHPSIFRVVDPKHVAVYNVKEPKSAVFEAAPHHIGKRGALPAGVLTTGSCFGFAGAMTCDPIIFIGSDLSWPTPEKVYAEGISKAKSDYSKASKFKGDCLLFPDINGDLVLTHQTFLVFWAWLRDNSKYITTRLINATGAGILQFEGMNVMSFQKAIDKYCQKVLAGVEEKILKAYNYAFQDGQFENLLLPPLKKKGAHHGRRKAPQDQGRLLGNKPGGHGDGRSGPADRGGSDGTPSDLRVGGQETHGCCAEGVNGPPEGR